MYVIANAFPLGDIQNESVSRESNEIDTGHISSFRSVSDLPCTWNASDIVIKMPPLNIQNKKFPYSLIFIELF